MKKIIILAIIILITSCYEQKEYIKNETSLKSGNTKQALAGYEKFLKDYPVSDFSAGAELGLIQAYIIDKNYKKALEKIDDFNMNYSGFVYKDLIDYLKIFCYYNQNKYNNIIVLVNKFKKKYPYSKLLTDVLIMKANVFLKKRDYTNLQKTADELYIKSDDPEAEGYASYYKGIIEMDKMPEQAVSDLRHAFNKINHGAAEAEDALYKISIIYDKLGKTTDMFMALDMYLEVYTQGIYSSEATFKIAKVLEGMGKMDEAIKYYILLKDKPDFSFYQMEAIVKLARYYDQQKNQSQTREMYQMLIDRYPDSDYINEARGYIGE